MGNIYTPISSLNTRYSIAALFLIAVLTMGLVITPIAFAPSALADEHSLCPLYGGNMRISWSGDVISFNTLINFWFRTTGYDVNVYDRLLKFGPNWELLPSLATSVKMEDGGKTHNISLRDDVKWHDGAEFTSDDVVWHYTYAATKATALITGKLTGSGFIKAEATGKHSLKIYYEKPTLPHVYAYTQAGALILPKHIYDVDIPFKDNPANWAPIGTGPFRVTEYEADQYTILEANMDYWNGRPCLDEIEIVVIPQPSTALLALESGDIDFMQQPSQADFDRINKNPDLEVQYWPATRIFRIVFNFREDAQEKYPWLADVKVRKAIAHAIDPQVMIDGARHGYGFEVFSPISKATAENYNPKTEELRPKFDPALANQLLDEAGWPKDDNGVRFTAPMIAGSRPPDPDNAELTKQMLKEVGIEVEIAAFEYAVMVAQYLKGPNGMTADYPLALGTTGTGADGDLRLNYLKSSFAPAGLNWNYWSHPRVEELVPAIMETFDDAKRQEMLKEVQEITATEIPEIYLWADPRHIAYNKAKFGGVENYRPVYVMESMRVFWSKSGEPLEVTQTETAVKTVTQEKEKVVTETTTDYTVTAAVAVIVAIVAIAGVTLYTRRSGGSSK